MLQADLLRSWCRTLNHWEEFQLHVRYAVAKGFRKVVPREADAHVNLVGRLEAYARVPMLRKRA